MGALTASAAEEITLERITALAKVYFRDSAEVPMLVDVTTVVMDKAGKGGGFDYQAEFEAGYFSSAGCGRKAGHS